MENLSKRDILKAAGIAAMGTAAYIGLTSKGQSAEGDADLFTAIAEEARLTKQCGDLETKWSEIIETLPPRHIERYGRKLRDEEDIHRAIGLALFNIDGKTTQETIDETVAEYHCVKEKYDHAYVERGLPALDAKIARATNEWSDVSKFIKHYPVRTSRGMAAKMKVTLAYFLEGEDIYDVIIADANRLN